MTGRELAVDLIGGARVKCSGLFNYFNPATGCIFLLPEVLTGADPVSLVVAAHECAHYRQWERHPWLFGFLWFLPVSWALEWGAWRGALREIAPMVSPTELRRCKRAALLRFFTYL